MHGPRKIGQSLAYAMDFLEILVRAIVTLIMTSILEKIWGLMKKSNRLNRLYRRTAALLTKEVDYPSPTIAWLFGIIMPLLFPTAVLYYLLGAFIPQMYALFSSIHLALTILPPLIITLSIASAVLVVLVSSKSISLDKFPDPPLWVIIVAAVFPMVVVYFIADVAFPKARVRFSELHEFIRPPNLEERLLELQVIQILKCEEKHATLQTNQPYTRYGLSFRTYFSILAGNASS